MSTPDRSIPDRILFFDGVCVLCNGLVDRLMRWDRGGALHYGPLQGSTAARLLPDLDQKQLNSIVYLRAGVALERSDAVLELLSDLGGVWKLLKAFKIFPKFIRDAVYGLIARNRYKWFGQRDSCRMPTEAERGLMLD